MKTSLFRNMAAAVCAAFAVFVLPLAVSAAPVLGDYTSQFSTNDLAVVSADLSDVTYNPLTETIFVVENGTPRINEYNPTDGTHLRTITLTNFLDTEGIDWMYGTTYVVVQERTTDPTLIIFEITSSTTAVNKNTDGTVITPTFSIANNGGMEGVRYDEENDWFYVAVEKQANGGNGGRVFRVEMDGASTEYTALGNALLTAGYTDLASLAYDSVSGNVFLLSQENSTIIEATLSGTLLNTRAVDTTIFSQPEGLEFSPDGTQLFIVGEADDYQYLTWTSSTSNTMNFSATHDVYVRAAAPTTNYGSSVELSADAADGGGAVESYLQFDISGIEGTVVEATLSLTTHSGSSATSDSTGLPYTVSNNNWTESGITWNNRPSRSGTAISGNTATSIGQNATKTFDVTSVVTEDGTYSFAIASASTNGVDYRSAEAGGLVPQLTVVFTSSSSTPPSDNPEVSIVNPEEDATVTGTVNVSATASDNDGIASVQFLLNGNALGAEDTNAPYALSWDTTTVADGAYLLAAVARDTLGNITTSTGVTIIVENEEPSEPQILTFFATHDAHVRAAAPTTNYGSNSQLSADAADGGGAIEAYLQFDVSGISGTITSAVLTLTTHNGSSAASNNTGLPYTVSNNNWTEGNITWNNRPSRSSTAVSGNTATSIGQNEAKNFNLTSAITGNGTYSFAVASASTNGVDYRSSEAGGNVPVLTITVMP